MKLLITRYIFGETFTIGKLYIDGSFFCHTLEDTCREEDYKGGAFEKVFQKVAGLTAIPSGTYNVVITYSPKFNKFLPLIQDVPGYSGIRIHSGNSSKDTEGCILVGEYKGLNDWISDSRKALDSLLPKMIDVLMKSDTIVLTIVNHELN
jgi:hypothetical protein